MTLAIVVAFGVLVVAGALQLRRAARAATDLVPMTGVTTAVSVPAQPATVCR